MAKDYAEQLRALQKKQQEATRSFAQAQARLEQAEKVRGEELEKLHEAGFANVGEAQEFVQQAEQKIMDALAEVERLVGA